MQTLSRYGLKHVRLIGGRFPLLHRSLAIHAKAKKEGDISSVFVSLSGVASDPLPERFAGLKRKLLRGREEAVVASWKRLLEELTAENKSIAEQGSDVVPQIKYEDLGRPSRAFEDAVRKRGVVVIRSVVTENEARRYKEETETYIRKNPQTKGKLPFKQDLQNSWPTCDTFHLLYT